MPDFPLDTKGRDEISAMAGHFNHMADALIDAIQVHEAGQKWLQAIMDIQNEYLFTVDLNRRINMVKQRMIDLYGLPCHELVGKECLEVIQSPNCAERCVLNDPDQRCPSGRGIEGVTEVPDGRTLPIRINNQVLKDEHGHVVGAVETFRDISDEKELARLKVEWEAFIRH